MADVQRIALLGATGSIGLSTLKVLRLHPEKYRLYGVSAHQNIGELAAICAEFQPAVAIVSDLAGADALRAALALRTQTPAPLEILVGAQALCTLAGSPEVQIVVAAIVGAAGLPSTLAAARAGKRLLLANKESLVVGGALVKAAAKTSGALILPIDSEHNALFQCLPAARPITECAGVAALWLTASGGPFRQASQDELRAATPAQACAHPNWQMGRKISVDSATLMNKGLEVIEAHWLFDLPASAIKVVIHPQSIVHSMVEYRDGSFLAQLGSPDMCTPISYALAYPARIDSGVARLNPLELANLTFSAPDTHRFPCLQLAFDALERGDSAPIVLNAANEIAVQSFLNGQLRFTDIPALINDCLQSAPIQSCSDLAECMEQDAQARRLARERLAMAFH